MMSGVGGFRLSPLEPAMALRHAASGDLLDVRPLGPALRDSRTRTLVQRPPIEVFRMVLPAGKAVPAHQVPGPITIQCIEGEVELELPQRSQVMHAGSLVYLDPKVVHGLKALQDASLLVTLARPAQTNPTE
jgi:quercetin dioxygenase-like cupin family protein